MADGLAVPVGDLRPRARLGEQLDREPSVTRWLGWLPSLRLELAPRLHARADVVQQRVDVGDGGRPGRPRRGGPGRTGTAQLGWGTIRMYGLGASNSPKRFRASSSETDPATMTFSPGFQLTGVETGCLALSCSESTTRRTSSKL